jgi:hypothetical protein
LTLPFSPSILANGFFCFASLVLFFIVRLIVIFYFNFHVSCNCHFTVPTCSLCTLLFIPLRKCSLRVSVSIPAFFLELVWQELSLDSHCSHTCSFST